MSLYQELACLGLFGTIICFYVAFIFEKYDPRMPSAFFAVTMATACTVMSYTSLLYEKLAGEPSFLLLLISPGGLILFLIYCLGFEKITRELNK